MDVAPASRPVMGPVQRTPLDLLVPIAGGLLAGVVLVTQPPLALLAAAAVFGGLALLWVGANRSTLALSLVVPALILGGMKFRIRSAAESLEGTVDANVLFELGVYGALLALILVVLYARKEPIFRATRAELWLYAYAAWVTVTTLWSVSPTFTAVRGLQTVILVLAAVTLVRLVPTRKLLANAGFSYAAIVLTATAMALIFPWANGSRTDWFSGAPRFAWFADHPIQCAMHAGLAAILVLTPVLARKHVTTRPWVTMSAIVVALLLAGAGALTASRAPLTGLLAAVAAMIAVRHFSVRQAAFVVVGIVGLVVLATALASPLMTLVDLNVEESTVLQMFLRSEGTANLLSFGGRLELWIGAMGLAAERLLTGYGFVASRGPLIEEFVWAGHVHNGPLQSVLDLGILGALLLWVPISVAAVRAIRTPLLTPTHAVTKMFIVGSLTFLVLTSLTDPSVAGPPGAALFFGTVAILLAERHCREAPAWTR